MTSQYEHSANAIGVNIAGDESKLLVETMSVLEVVLLKKNLLGIEPAVDQNLGRSRRLKIGALYL